LLILRRGRASPGHSRFVSDLWNVDEDAFFALLPGRDELPVGALWMSAMLP
jgi:hypothetical protein